MVLMGRPPPIWSWAFVTCSRQPYSFKYCYEIATCALVSSLEAVLVATAARTLRPSWRLYYAVVQNLIHGCGNVPQTTDSCDTPPTYCAQHVQKSVDMPIQCSAGLQCDPVQMGEVVQQEYVLVGRTWLYHRVNFTNTVHLSRYHRYCLQSHNRGRKDRPLERHLIAHDCDKWITNTTTLQYAHTHTILPMNTVLEGVAFFRHFV